MPGRPSLEDLAEDLELACMDAIGGDPPGPNMVVRLQRVVREQLYRRGIEGRVEVESTRAGTRVRVLVGPPGPKVKELRLTLG